MHFPRKPNFPTKKKNKNRKKNPSHYLNQCWHIVNLTRAIINEILIKILNFSFAKTYSKYHLQNGCHFVHVLNIGFKWTQKRNEKLSKAMTKRVTDSFLCHQAAMCDNCNKIVTIFVLGTEGWALFSIFQAAQMSHDPQWLGKLSSPSWQTLRLTLWGPGRELFSILQAAFVNYNPH